MAIAEPASFVGARSMYDRVRIAIHASLAGVLTCAFALPAVAASPQSDADVLAQKFIDGPKNEAKAVSARKQLERLLNMTATRPIHAALTNLKSSGIRHYSHLH